MMPGSVSIIASRRADRRTPYDMEYSFNLFLYSLSSVRCVRLFYDTVPDSDRGFSGAVPPAAV